MKFSNLNPARLLGTAALGASLLASGGCDQVAEACGFECPTEGIEQGNADITGLAAIDGFFQSVINFRNVSSGVAGDIQGELDGIRLAVGVTDAELESANGNLGAAISAKLQADFEASIEIQAQPPRCEVDARVTAEASVECQVEAGCDIDPGNVSVECMGQCTVEASVEGGCEAEAQLKCEVSGPTVSCMGECSGACSVEGELAADCSGECTGSCDLDASAGIDCAGACTGTCDGEDVDGAACEGTCTGSCELDASAGIQCNGTCNGSCAVSGMAALDCQGSCNGTCKADPGGATCEANAKASCELNAEASATCTGKCEGEFNPPMADCSAAASCDASAKADAEFNASCSPPSVEIVVTVGADLDVEAQARLDYIVGELRLRVPRLLASLKKGEVVIMAGLELGSDAAAAIEGSLEAIAEGDINVRAAFRLTCSEVGDQFRAVGGVIAASGEELNGSYCAGLSIGASLGGMSTMDASPCS